jgi:hypothetical protein
MKPVLRVAALAALGIAASGCGNWHQLRPLTANNIQVGGLTLYVANAEYAERRDIVKVVLVVDNPSQEMQQFDPQWIALRGSTGVTYQPTHIQPPMPSSVPPGYRLQTTYMFYHVPQNDTGQLSILVAGTETMKFAGVYQ